MSVVSRVLTVWSGAPVVGGGVSVMYCTENGEHDLMAAFRAFLDAIDVIIPSSLQWTFPPAGVVITQENGEASGSWVDGTPLSPLSGSSSNTWVNGVGLRIKWTTDAIFEGDHVTGSTFIVPIHVNSYEGAGNIVDSTIALVQSAATSFVAAAGLRIYSRPRPGVDGQSFAVNGAVVPDRVSWLRGRRT